MIEKVQGEVIGVGKSVPPQNEQITPVVSTAATVKEATGLKALWKGFFAEDLKTVRKNVMKTVIEPSIKSGILNAVTCAVSMWLFGKNGYTNAPGGMYRPFIANNSTAYNSIVRLQNGQIISNANSGPKVSVGDSNVGKFTSAEVYNPEYIHYASYEDAMNVYNGICERIGKYTVATVRDLYKLSSLETYDMVLQNWGWYGVEWYRILPAGDGTWFLKLPQPTPVK